ncbi:hypothetical protein PCANC_14248 [Puccinia coronata f. sp. avenae]|uniref:Uncharacterized protein n=1 Tax=Puccinia coronata f. sp. avenae TaxID=200324 RepID=A0A2N5UQ72_9BASI|nr:hypothetical protein PCANC_14248 [Puccinia coronata f. sp. avenae]
MSNNWTAFSKSRDGGEQEDEEVIAVVSPSRVNLQKAYESLCIIGVVFTSILLISHTFGRRKQKRHPIVIAFIATALLNYWNALLPWLFHFLATQNSSSPSQNLAVLQQDRYAHFACRINAVLASYLQTVIPSFAAAFVGEALRITWQVSKMTYSNSLSSFTDYSITTHQLLNSTTEQKDRKKPFSVDDEDHVNFHFPSPLPKVDNMTDIKHDLMSHEHTFRNMVETPDILTPPGSLQYSKGSILKCSMEKKWKWPFILCLVPTLCGLPQLLLILVSYLQTGKAWISIDIISCRVRSEAAAALGVITLLFVLSLTALLSGIMLSILLRIPQSIAGCLVIAVMFFASESHYRAALDLFGVINPIVSAFVLTDWEFFTIWNYWISSFLKILLGFKSIDCPAQSSPTLSNRAANKFRHCNTSTEGAYGDSDIGEGDNLWARLSRQVTVTRPSRFRSLRKMTLRRRSGGPTRGGPTRQNTTKKRRRVGVFLKRLSNYPRQSVPPEKLKTRVCPSDFSYRAEHSQGSQEVSKERSNVSFVPEKTSGPETSKVQYFETFILQMDSEPSQKSQQQYMDDVVPSRGSPVGSSKRKTSADNSEMKGKPKYRQASKSF